MSFFDIRLMINFIHLFISLFIFSYLPIQMVLIMEMLVEIFRQQMVPMVIQICIHHHLLMKQHHHHLFLIIYKLYLHLSVNLRQLQILRTVLMSIIKPNNIKIWSTGKWEANKRSITVLFFYYFKSYLSFSFWKKNEESDKFIFLSFFFFFLITDSFLFHQTYLLCWSNVKIDRLLRCY